MLFQMLECPVVMYFIIMWLWHYRLSNWVFNMPANLLRRGGKLKSIKRVLKLEALNSAVVSKAHLNHNVLYLSRTYMYIQIFNHLIFVIIISSYGVLATKNLMFRYMHFCFFMVMVFAKCSLNHFLNFFLPKSHLDRVMNFTIYVLIYKPNFNE